MAVYATAADYTAAGYGTAPATIEVLLRSASKAVDQLMLGVVYDTDTEGLPTDTEVATDLRDATLAIAAEANATGALEVGGGAREWESVKIGTVSLSGGKGGTLPTVNGMPVPATAHLALSGYRPTVVVRS